MKPVLCVFAHPDDEAFGPSGTIAKLASERDVYIICATDGDAAFGPRDGSLAKLRREELLTSSKILGVKEVIFFDFSDGDLSNNLYHDLADKVREKVEDLKPEIIITFDQKGVSGHIDHIVVSMVSTFIFQKEPSISELWYFVNPKELSDMVNDYFVYFPPGIEESEADKVIDISEFFDKKIEAIKAHKSQHKDGDWVLKMLKIVPKKEYFLIASKANKG